MTAQIRVVLMTLVFVGFATGAKAQPARRMAAAQQRECERLLLQAPIESTPAAQVMRARKNAKTVALLGLLTFGVGYGASIITTGILTFGRMGVALGAHSGSSEAKPRSYYALEHWTEPLIPFVGAFMFAGHAREAGFIALGLSSGVVQALGAFLIVYGLWTRPASPSELKEGLTLDPTGLTLRF